jgi:hypothetical protein
MSKNDKTKKKACVFKNEFTTLTAFKYAALNAILMDSKPDELIKYNKKGKPKFFQIKKGMIIEIIVHEKFDVLIDGNKVNPAYFDIKEEQKKSDIWNAYRISINQFFKAIKESISPNTNGMHNIIFAVDRKTGESFKIWEVSKSIGKIVGTKKDGKKNVSMEIRFDI